MCCIGIDLAHELIDVLREHRLDRGRRQVRDRARQEGCELGRIRVQGRERALLRARIAAGSRLDVCVVGVDVRTP